MNFFKVTAIFLFLSVPYFSNADQALGYRTTGIGSLEKCKKLGVQLCDSEKVAIPAVIDSSDSSWAGTYHKTKKDGSSLCWTKIKKGAFVEETLSFDCQPIR